MNQEHLEQLRKQLPEHPHYVGNLPLSKWEAAGRPYCWSYEAHIAKDMQAFADTGYGLSAIFNNGQLMSVRKGMLHIATSDKWDVIG